MDTTSQAMSPEIDWNLPSSPHRTSSLSLGKPYKLSGSIQMSTHEVVKHVGSVYHTTDFKRL